MKQTDRGQREKKMCKEKERKKMRGREKYGRRERKKKLKMIHDLMYGKKCKTPLCWNEIGEWKLNDVELIEITSEKI